MRVIIERSSSSLKSIVGEAGVLTFDIAISVRVLSERSLDTTETKVSLIQSAWILVSCGTLHLHELGHNLGADCRGDTSNGGDCKSLFKHFLIYILIIKFKR